MSQNQGMAASLDESFLDGEHAIFLEQIYHQYLANPSSVTAEWQQYFQAMETAPAINASGSNDATAVENRTQQ